jgi:hypothetical protein
MKIGRLILIVHLAVTYVEAQQFQDLDFEAPGSQYIREFGQGGGSVAVAQGLPGWKVVVGSQPLSTIYYNDAAETVAFAALHSYFYGETNVGRYGFTMHGATASPTDPTLVGVSLSQTAQIPASAKTLEFAGSVSEPTFHVFVGNVQLTLERVRYLQASTSLYAADITPWAGKVEELRFTVDPTAPPFNGSGANLDNITFSPIPLNAPEAQTWALVTLGSLVLSALSRLGSNRR